jgi:hypothetical protein
MLNKAIVLLSQQMLSLSLIGSVGKTKGKALDALPLLCLSSPERPGAVFVPTQEHKQTHTHKHTYRHTHTDTHMAARDRVALLGSGPNHMQPSQQHYGEVVVVGQRGSSLQQ